MKKIKTIQARIIEQDGHRAKIVLEADFGQYDWRHIKLSVPHDAFKSVYETESKTLTKEG